MSGIRAICAAITMLALLLAGSFSEPAAGQEQAMVTVEFNLRLYGAVPPGDGFALEAEPDLMPLETHLCGPDFGDGPCAGGGRVYRASHMAYEESSMSFHFARLPEDWLRGGRQEWFAVSGEGRRYDEPTVVDAYYAYDDRGRPLGGGFGVAPPGWEDRQQAVATATPAAIATPAPVPTGLPETGAGGAVDAPTWLVGAVAGGAALAGAGLAAARLRRGGAR